MPLCQQGAGTDEHALIEILVTRSNEEIQAMNAAYQAGEFETKPGLWSICHSVKDITCCNHVLTLHRL